MHWTFYYKTELLQIRAHHRFLMLAMMVTMLSHPRAVHSLEDLPDLRCALQAQIAHSYPQKPLEHSDGIRIRAKPVFIAFLPS